MNFRTALIASAIATLGASAWAQGSTPPTPAAPSTMTMPARTQQDMHKDVKKDMKKDKLAQKHDKAAKDEKKVGHKKHQKKDADHKLQPATHKPGTMGTSATQLPAR